MALLQQCGTGMLSDHVNTYSRPGRGCSSSPLRIVIPRAASIENAQPACPFAGTAAYNALQRQSKQEQLGTGPKSSSLAELRGPGWSALLPDYTLPQPQSKHSWNPLHFLLGDYPELQQGEMPFLLERFRLFGPVFKWKLGPDTVITVLEHDTITSLLKHGDGKVMAFWSPPALAAFTSAESQANMETPAARMKQRKTLAPGFSRQALRQVLGKVESICRRKLEAWAATGQAVDLAKEGRELSFDFSTELLVDFDVPDAQRAAMKGKLDAMFKAMLSPPVHFPGSPFSKGVKARHELIEEIKRIIESGSSGSSGSSSRGSSSSSSSSAVGSSAFQLILQALRESHSEDGQLSADTIAQSGISLLLAGTDTSGGGVTAAMAMLSVLPEVMEKLRAEQQQVQAEFGPTFSLHALDAMPYAEAVIKEALRLAPPAGVVMRRTLVDMEICGKYVPAGSLLYLSTFTAMNLADSANLNSGHTLSSMNQLELEQLKRDWSSISYNLLKDQFRPERWLRDPQQQQQQQQQQQRQHQRQQQDQHHEQQQHENDAEALADASVVGGPRSPSAAAAPQKSSGLLTFSAGPHVCLGMSLFMVEAKVLLALLARGYELQPEAPRSLEFGLTLLAQLSSNAGSRVRFVSVNLPSPEA